MESGYYKTIMTKLKIKQKILVLLCLSVSYFSPTMAQTTYYNGKAYTQVNNKWQVNFPNENVSYPVVDDIITLKYATGTTNAQISTFENINGLTLRRKASTGWTDYNITNVPNSILTFASTLQASTIIEKVEVVTEGEFHQIPNDPNFSVQWALQQASNVDINVPEAWDINTGNPTVRVAVIDGGIDFTINDLGLGNDNYQNIYLNSGEDAWTDPNDPTTGNGIDDDGNGLVDDWKGYNFGYNTNDTRSLDGTVHGTGVSSIIAAKTNNGEGISGVAGGWNNPGAKIIAISVEHPDPNSFFAFLSSEIDNAILYAVDQGADIINLSLGTSPTQDIEDALQAAYNAGVVIIASSGNKNSPTNIVYPANHPLTISVGGSTETDVRWEDDTVGFQWGTPIINGSHGGIHSDVVAPCTNMTGLITNNVVVSNATGTSFSAPLVSGIVALMLSENHCLTPDMIRNILHSTSKKVGGYDYYWDYNNPGHSKLFGFGRVDAYEAVKAAEDMYSATPDLYMRDHISDIGSDAGYTFTWDFDASPDIWVRKINDGYTNQVAEELEYSTTIPNYVYVRIGNKSCVPTSGNEILKLYASAAGSNASWPTGWDGSIFGNGGQTIGQQTIPVLQPGQDTILEIPWTMLYNANHCVLARIENSTDDPITSYPGDLAQEIYQNNNIALRNVIVQNIYPGKAFPVFNDVAMPHGSTVTVGNDNSTLAETYDFEFFANNYEGEKPLTKSAEVTLTFTSAGWTIFEPAFLNRSDVKIIGDQTVQLLASSVKVENISIEKRTSFPIYVGYSFLTDEIDNQRLFEYHVVQKRDAAHTVLGDHWTGGVHFKIKRNSRTVFNADAGSDVGITAGESVTLTADNIGEDATYNWYNSAGTLVHTGTRLITSPGSTETYTLEVIADADGYKDYDEVTVTVSTYYISSVAPNPASTNLTISYKVSGASNAELAIINVNDPAESYSVVLSTRKTEESIDVSEWSTSVYSIVLICDGQIVDNEGLIVE